MTLEELFALIRREYGGRSESPFVQDSLAERGAFWVMDLGGYKAVRAACQAAGAVYPPGEEDPDAWVPKPEDRLYGLRVVVREGGGAPHLEYPVS